jgi:hypothetical protein
LKYDLKRAYIRKVWGYKNADLDKLNTLIHGYDWQSIINDNSPIDLATKNNNKLYWKLIKEVFQVKSNNEIPPIQFTSENGANSIAFSDKEKSEVLNKYFSSISNIDDTSHILPDSYPLCNDNLNDIFIEEQEVIDIIATLPVNKAIGPDCISHKMLKSTAHTIS